MPTIKLFANLRKIAAQKEVPVTGTTLNAVLNGLLLQCPALEGLILENGHLRPGLILTINGHNATDLHSPVAEEDTIAIFPPIAGG